MKIVFVGPSVWPGKLPESGIDIRPPAGQGDILGAVRDGASVIGLVDGTFEQNASVWHKEILFALSEGVQVLGAASMGALRAAECHAFGMQPIGRIASDFISGILEADDEVAFTFGPAEMDFAPLSLALVDIRATVAVLVHADLIGSCQGDSIVTLAQALHFKERTLERLFAGDDRVAGLFRTHFRRQKMEDTLLLLDRVAALPDRRGNKPEDWQFSPSPAWTDFSGRMSASPA